MRWVSLFSHKELCLGQYTGALGMGQLLVELAQMGSGLSHVTAGTCDPRLALLGSLDTKPSLTNRSMHSRYVH